MRGCCTLTILCAGQQLSGHLLSLVLSLCQDDRRRSPRDEKQVTLLMPDVDQPPGGKHGHLVRPHHHVTLPAVNPGDTRGAPASLLRRQSMSDSSDCPGRRLRASAGMQGVMMSEFFPESRLRVSFFPLAGRWDRMQAGPIIYSLSSNWEVRR